MRHLELEVIFDMYIVGFGYRQMVKEDDDAATLWEVYTRLLSGVDVVFQDKCTLGEAEQLYRYRVAEAMLGGTNHYVSAPINQSCVDADYVTRIFVDSNVNDHAVVVEDVTAKQYLVMEGSKDDCTLAARSLSLEVLRRQSRTPIGDGDQPTAIGEVRE
jgi:hypothetical protein